ncbi:MAG: methionyl aminopeptidase [Simkaniaceae bacterium]
MIHRNDPCWCNSGKKWKRCHYPQKASNEQAALKEEYWRKYQIRLKTPEEIEGIRKAAKATARILKETCAIAKEGVTTNEIDAFAHKLHREIHARPAPLGYGDPPFPKCICTSLNEVICHGIPNDIPLKNGDILNIDTSLELNGFFGDCSSMVMIGEVSDEKKHVVAVSKECLKRSIALLKPGIFVYEIAEVIEDYAKAQKCSVVNQFVGHGIGLQFHEAPSIPHHYNKIKIPLVQGMTFTIEPMINAGVREGKINSKNHWEARTLDGKPSAQFEHQLLITEDGREILTLIEEDS